MGAGHAAVHLGPFDFHNVGVQTDDKIIRTSIAGVAVETLASAIRALSPEDRERLVTAHAVAEAQWTWRLSISWPLPLCLRHLCGCRLGRSCLTLTTWRSFRALKQSCRRLVGAQGRGPVPPVFDMMIGVLQALQDHAEAHASDRPERPLGAQHSRQTGAYVDACPWIAFTDLEFTLMKGYMARTPRSMGERAPEANVSNAVSRGDDSRVRAEGWAAGTRRRDRSCRSRRGGRRCRLRLMPERLLDLVPFGRCRRMVGRGCAGRAQNCASFGQCPRLGAVCHCTLVGSFG